MTEGNRMSIERMNMIALLAALVVMTQSCPCLAQSKAPAKGKATKSSAPSTKGAPASSSGSSTAPTGANTARDPMELVHKLEPMLPKLFDSAKASVHSLMPEPAAYEKTLPPRQQVVEKKDQLNFKNYAGLSEAYLFDDQLDKAEELFQWCQSNYVNVLGKTDHFVPGLVTADFGLYHFYKNNFTKAEPLCRSSVDVLTKYGPPSAANNLVANFLVLCLICDKQKRSEEARTWAQKLIELSIAQNKPKPAGQQATTE